MKKLRIMQVTTESGVQMVFVLPLAKHLREQGHEVVLACSDDPGEAGKSFVEPLRNLGFEVVVLPLSRKIAPYSDLMSVWKLYRYLRENRFDVVHSRTAKGGMVGRLAAWLAGVPAIIYTSHAFSFHERLDRFRMRFYAFLERMGAYFCHAMAVDSQAVKSRALMFGVGTDEKIQIIPMGADAGRFDPAKYPGSRASVRAEFGIPVDCTVIGSVSRLVADKGLDIFLEAARIIVEKQNNVRFLMVGNGPLKPELEALAKKLDLGAHLIFAGHRSDIPQVLSAMDIFMLPTLREGFGVVFAESMSMGVPVVSSRISPITEVVADGETGILAQKGNAQAFAEAALRLIESPELRARMGRAGRKRVEREFNMDKCCRSYEHLILNTYERVSK